jgi:RND family efflux transporter MFP subunit
MVRAGRVLFVIEPEPYQAAFAEAEASVATAQSQLATATSDLERVELAAESDAVSQQDVDRAVAARDQAAASLLAAEARRDRARINLGYTQVRSPLAGQVSRNFVDVGNLVGSGSATLLTTVSKVQPIYVYFDAPERLVLTLLGEQRSETRSEVERGEIGRVSVATAADSGFPHEGRIDFIDNTVDPATGTIELRAVLTNEDLQLFPGLFVRVRVVGAVRDDALVINERALQTDLGGKYVLVVGDSNVVDRQYVTLGPVQDGGTVVVESGLEGTERYIIDGLLRARPGFPVQPAAEGS